MLMVLRFEFVFKKLTNIIFYMLGLLYICSVKPKNVKL